MRPSTVGPGIAIDTKIYFIICLTVLDGCMGSLGRKKINHGAYGLVGTTSPVITIRDMVKEQTYLLEHRGIDRLLAVAGGSMGGMKVLQFTSL